MKKRSILGVGALFVGLAVGTAQAGEGMKMDMSKMPMGKMSMKQKMSMDKMNMGKMSMAGRPDMAPPPSVMGGHSPKEGKFMVSVSRMSMLMDGNRKGTNKVSLANVLTDFMVTPIDMTMDMTMASGMYGVTDDFSVMVMVPWIKKNMQLKRRNGAIFKTTSSGFGDVKLAGSYNAYKAGVHSVKLGFGVSLPTGSTEQRDDTPMGDNSLLGYPMQLGSGTYDLLPSVTYTGMNDNYSWGSQVGATVRLGRNSRHYTLGDNYQLSLWGGRKINDWAALFARVQGKIEKNYSGADPDLNTGMAPTNRTDLRGAKRVNLSAGVNFMAPSGPLEGVGLAFEVGAPVYQNLKGPQLEQDYTLGVKLRLAL